MPTRLPHAESVAAHCATESASPPSPPISPPGVVAVGKGRMKMGTPGEECCDEELGVTTEQLSSTGKTKQNDNNNNEGVSMIRRRQICRLRSRTLDSPRSFKAKEGRISEFSINFNRVLHTHSSESSWFNLYSLIRL
ncbi:unnamed protein product [Protopolystoma xenopodis]|uniref:Uncharacterized protein n=1 Tax=Protopolystoma xenopodis TaxID=117903 RepID=A0A3S5CRL5_9PLAT|nr:unnamed protein product [Protopolystoma xenopodis]